MSTSHWNEKVGINTIPQHPVLGQGKKTDNLMRIFMNKSNQHYPYRLTGESVKNYSFNKKNKKLTLIDKLILLFGGLFIFYFLTLFIK